jgi:hypothetical protein
MSIRRHAALFAFLSAVTIATPAIAQMRLGGELQVGTGTAYLHAQFVASAASDSAGNFVVVWSNFHPGRLETRGERFSASGAPIGAEFQVSSYTSAYDIFPSAAIDAAGNFVVVWSRVLLGSGGSQSNGGVQGQRFDANGAKLGGEFQVNTGTTFYGVVTHASVASDPGGNFVVTWTNSDGDFVGAAAQLFSASGARVGGEFEVNTYTTGIQGLPTVAMDATGNFVITWSQYEGANQRIMGQRFDPNGTRLGGEFQINTYTTSLYSRIAMKADGSFVVVWEEVLGPSSSEVRGRTFGATGAALGPEFVATSFTTGDLRPPSVGMDNTGGFTVVWPDRTGRDGDAFGIFAHQFAPTGVAVGSDFQVNTYTTGNQAQPGIAMSPAGKFVVVWQSYSSGAAEFQQFGFALERQRLRFGVEKSGTTLTNVTPPQPVAISIAGAWTAVSNQPFVTVTPSGSGSGLLTVQVVNGAGLPATGAAPQATITVTSADLPTLPQTITVDVQVYAPGTTNAPFGFFDTPVSGATGVTGAIAVTGWALDDIGVTGVQIWRDPVAGDPTPAANGKIFVGDAKFVTEARPDVDALNAALPLSYRGAWGYMLLTNMLPNVGTLAPAGGVGTFNLYAYVYDVEGHATVFPAHTITVDDTTATKPFGTIDTPGPGAIVSGTITNFGWVLTPKPATIPTNGSTIQLFIDGTQRGTAVYDAPRSDIAALFPGYNNTGGPVGAFTIDTTTLANGVHTIFWVVTDDQARTDGIGSRFFTVLN